MTVLLILIFTALALAAAAFAAWPLARARGGAPGWILAAAVTCLVLGIGGGAYLMVGSPQIALRTLAGPDMSDRNGIVAVLASNARAHPRDERAWVMLARGYLMLHDGENAAGALRHALTLAPAAHRAVLLDQIGEALTGAASGQVTPEAEDAFTQAVQIDPHDVAARFYLGFAYAARRDNARAIAAWRSVLADVPPKTPLYDALTDHIAQLTFESGNAPDPAAMVAMLAARLKAQPDDPEGWQRLVRSYVVLGEPAKAQAALDAARAALKSNAPALAALTQEARQLGLKKP